MLGVLIHSVVVTWMDHGTDFRNTQALREQLSSPRCSCLEKIACMSEGG